MDAISPLLRAKAYDEPSVFEPANLLREGRRQRGRPDIAVPPVCVLDPDGDIVRHLTATGRASEHPGWACYHTTLGTFDLGGRPAWDPAGQSLTRPEARRSKQCATCCGSAVVPPPASQ